MATTQPAEKSIRLAVMGVTGSGKSTFIKRATQSEEVGVGHSYESHTADVRAFTLHLDGHRITLIDTPGFNDTTRSEAEVLTEIANFLDFTYRNPPHLKLAGILYLQSIEDPRMYGSSLRNLKMFKDLCGEEPMKNVLLVTNRWGKARRCGELDKALAKEVELRESPRFWAPLIRRGSRTARWEEDTPASALGILRGFLSRTPEPEVLQIQTELVDRSLRLIDTAAGATVNEEALRVERKYRAELESIQSEMADAVARRDVEVQLALEEARGDYERKLERLREEQELLRYERRNEARKLRNEMEDLRAAYNRRLEEELSKRQLEFDEVVERLMANQDQLREEQRRVMKEEIAALRKEKKEKEPGSGVRLVLSLVGVVGSVVLGILGVVL